MSCGEGSIAILGPGLEAMGLVVWCIVAGYAVLAAALTMWGNA